MITPGMMIMKNIYDFYNKDYIIVPTIRLSIKTLNSCSFTDTILINNILYSFIGYTTYMYRTEIIKELC